MEVFPGLIRDTIYFYEWYLLQKQVICEYKERKKYSIDLPVYITWEQNQNHMLYNHRSLDKAFIPDYHAYIIRIRRKNDMLSYIQLPKRYMYSSGKLNKNGYK